MKIDVVLSPPEIDLLPQRDLSGATAVVFDVLRATSTMITALGNGAAQIFPARSIEEALALQAQMPAAKLGGERQGDRIEGFDLGNSPLEYGDVRGAKIITTTTNGTIALRACEHAREVLVGALLNLDAVTERVRGANELLLVCAGTFREAALEDVLAAGLLCAQFPEAELSDSARIAAAVCTRFQNDLPAGIRAGKNGRALLAKGREDQLRWCEQISTHDVIGILKNGAVERASE